MPLVLTDAGGTHHAHLLTRTISSSPAPSAFLRLIAPADADVVSCSLVHRLMKSTRVHHTSWACVVYYRGVYAILSVCLSVTRGALKTQVLENASTEKASTKQRISQGWKTHVRKTQVRICRDGKRKYGKCKYNAKLQSDKKSLVSLLRKLVWCIFKWGGQEDYWLFFSEIT